ncbi:hypothetical protein AVEN_115060-1 [Araneus ventricosus]|uniref:DDE-1 domain-containing protein n=1 Tax=Araneus ventricosus TaxID=182803 RepID=A0A4Y1ZX38_ARAVE|nr:hypothetical protein AVEN_115060-1 [Araneus ventricosus]
MEALLVLDNGPFHPSKEELKDGNIQTMFFPPNGTALIQPIGTGRDRECEEKNKPHGRMAIQAGKSITSWPQLVSVPLTGLERMLSSSLNMDLSLPTSKDFTCLTAIIAVVVELARHFTMPRSVSIQCLGI